MVMEFGIEVADTPTARAFLLSLDVGAGIPPLQELALGGADAISVAERVVGLRLGELLYSEEARMGLRTRVMGTYRRVPDATGRYPQLVLRADPPA